MNTLERKQKTEMGEHGDLIKTIFYDPMGTTHDLQRDITELMHDICIQDGDITLAELGYLHMSSISYKNGGVICKVYFVPELAMKSSREFNTNTKILVDKMSIFQNYLFIGPAKDAVSFEEINTPKYTIVKDDLGKPAVSISDGKKIMEDHPVIALNCNLNVLMAAIVDTSVLDPEYKIHVESVGKGNETDKKKKKHESREQDEDLDRTSILISAGTRQEYPVKVSVSRTADESVPGFDPDEVPAWIRAKYQAYMASRNTQRNLAENVQDRVLKQTKKEKKKRAASFGRYR